MFHAKLQATIDRLLPGIEELPPERVEKLAKVTAYIQQQVNANQPVRLNFICTHNSRRSHLGQLWGQVAAMNFGFSNVSTFSGGTEATAFNPRAVAAIERAGFEVTNPGGDNPRYEVSLGPDSEAQICFSKRYDDAENPQAEYAAIMTCTDADQNCPVIPDATRLSLPYRDPKEADDTDQESARYSERSDQIATEMLAVFGSVQVD